MQASRVIRTTHITDISKFIPHRTIASYPFSLHRTQSTMTTAVFKYLDPASLQSSATKPWAKVDVTKTSFKLIDSERPVHNLRENQSEFTTDTSGFAVYTRPAKEKAFTDETAIREGYYQEVESLLREKLPGVKKVVIFDHTIRRREKASPRQPVQQVHVDQTPSAAEARVRRHVSDPKEAEELINGRFQIINVWRPIENPASDFPLAVVDWRSTTVKDLVAVDLLYPKRESNGLPDDDDDRGKEVLADEKTIDSTEGYEVKGETFGVAPSDKHRFYYAKDMTPDEAMFIKCFDSRGQFLPKGIPGVAMYTPHTAFIDPETPEDAPGRQSIEVRCLVFYE